LLAAAHALGHGIRTAIVKSVSACTKSTCAHRNGTITPESRKVWVKLKLKKWKSPKLILSGSANWPLKIDGI
jgi:hypothetical protein